MNNEQEEMLRRQSAPKPTFEDELQKYNSRGIDLNGAKNGFEVLKEPIGTEALKNANQLFQQYKSGKENFNARIISNEEWYRLRHWGQVNKKADTQVEPVSAWLFNCICNKHADAMDNYPCPNVLPRERNDKDEANRLSSILPVILENNDFEKTYSDCWDDKLRSGTAVYGVFWDSSKLNGLGDIAISNVDILNLYWEPGITNFQSSQNVFYVALIDNKLLESKYPQLQGKLNGGKGTEVKQYIYDDTVDTSNKTPVIDWYYKKINSEGKQVLHFVKYVNDTVLYATENDEKLAERGLYDHGKYPFFFDTLFNIKGSVAGFGYIDVGKSAQEYIDKGNQAIMENLLSNAAPRYFVKEESGINTEDYADLSKRFIQVTGGGNLDDRIKAVDGKQLDGVYVNVILNKIEELKETTGNRDVSSGGTTGGVTAASAVAALQEAGSKLSRDHNKASYRVFREVCITVIELIRQFYDFKREFRIIGQDGLEDYVEYTNRNLQASKAESELGVDAGARVPAFDIEITAEKKSPYSKMAQNELALQFYNAGFFEPARADQALTCLEIMDFDRKNFVIQKIQKNQTMMQTIQQLQQQLFDLAKIVDELRGNNVISKGLAAQFGIQNQVQQPTQSSDAELTDLSGESSVTRKARERAAEATSPT